MTIGWIPEIIDKGSLVLAGAAGGIVRWLTLREKLWPDGLVSIVVGSLASLYLADYLKPLFPAALHALPWLRDVAFDQSKLSSLSGFVVGLSGIVLAGAVMDFAKFKKWRGKEK